MSRAHIRLRGIAQLVERGFHTPRQPQVRILLPRPGFAGLAKWEGNGSWPRHEAVRSRQPVRACSSSVERRTPNPRQRGFNSFLARHCQSGRSPHPATLHGDQLAQMPASTSSQGSVPVGAPCTWAAHAPRTHALRRKSLFRRLCSLPPSLGGGGGVQCDGGANERL